MITLLEKAEFIRNLRKKALSLEKKGADIKNLIGELQTNQIAHKLLSKRSEIDSLELLCRIHKLENNHKYEGKGDHTFVEDRIIYEVITLTWELDEIKRLHSTLHYLTEKYATQNTFTQVIYGDHPSVIQFPYTQQQNSNIILNNASEILVSAIPYYKGIERKTQGKIRKAKSQILKKEKSSKFRRVVILDMRDVLFGLEYLTNRIKKWLKMKNINLDGILLLVTEFSQKNSFVVIPNPTSRNSIHPNDYEEVRSKSPLTSEWIFAMPMCFKVNIIGEYNIISRTSDGSWYFWDIELGKSLLAGETAAFTGYLGYLTNISRMRFFVNGRLASEFSL